LSTLGSTSLKLSLVDESASTVVDDFVDADAVGHRIVHFGDLLVEAELVEDWLILHIEEGAEVAPLHNQPALDALRSAQQALPNLPHVAVSDSYFHHTMPDYVRKYAVPADWAHITRHGFHGLAVSSIAERLPVPRLVVCHLGGGASVTAVLGGRSVDTTMGYTPLEGFRWRRGPVPSTPAPFCTCSGRGCPWRSSTACSTRNRG
jgi:acetate kinase